MIPFLKKSASSPLVIPENTESERVLHRAIWDTIDYYRKLGMVVNPPSTKILSPSGGGHNSWYFEMRGSITGKGGLRRGLYGAGTSKLEAEMNFLKSIQREFDYIILKSRQNS